MQARPSTAPRSDGSHPTGEPAPWARLAPEARRGIGVGRVREAAEARHRVLGRAEQVSEEEHLPAGTRAAVLVPIFEEEGEARVVLTRRAAQLRTHPGEVSFPGGRLDAGEIPEEGALREAAEEIALDRGSVEVVGRLTPLSTLSSGAAITPVVGVLPSRPKLVVNPSEVERVFDVALADLAVVEVFREERLAVLGTLSPVWFFELDEDTVWGATARILVELLRLVLDV
ncbi:MAG: CoA pyrophosphatase [Acidimicrobiales bacterium]